MNVARDVDVVDASRKHHAGEMIALRILLPVQEMRLRRDLQFIRQDRRARVRRGTQADDLRRWSTRLRLALEAFPPEHGRNSLTSI